MGDAEAKLIQIAERLRAAREYMGFSQAEIGQMTGLDSAAIVDIESGAREVEAEELNLLSKIYRRSAEYLLTGSEPAYSGPEQFSFLARATKGLSTKDKEEVAQFAEFLRASDAS
ncbi:helix-turn-helix domain-containing protein [Marinobacterium sp. D7]|uniref:helix-turn-helix domain-containing protein n=1 Tax=Marinobacterium ramblicola TaxID=2849041 RepID=UPI001C2D9F5D|nr:helix-turn-helix transcriptional regulator [Marinobacterium ramblicola]MBV1790360.1 helix-turn-helix domain-containing protein [Marinobacterium ramblicola]